MKDYDLNQKDNLLLQFARLLAALNPLIDDKMLLNALNSATLVDMGIKDAIDLINKASQVSTNFKLLENDEPMVIRRSHATSNGDKDYTVNYDGGISIVSTDGRSLWNIDLNHDGSVCVSSGSVVRHKGELLNSKVMIEPLASNSVTLRRATNPTQ